jgi:hypothetical protein
MFADIAITHAAFPLRAQESSAIVLWTRPDKCPLFRVSLGSPFYNVFDVFYARDINIHMFDFLPEIFDLNVVIFV